MSLATLRYAALAAFVPVLLACADLPLRTFGQRFVAHRWAERLVLLSIEMNLLLLWLLARVVLGRDAPLAPAGLEPVLAAAGAAIAWAGALFAVWARLVLGHWFSGTFGVKPGHELVTRGPYAVVRHPMYLGLVTLGAGVAIAHDSAVSLVVALAFIVPFALHALVEEQMFARHFGEAWQDYARRVPRLFPRWPRRPA